VLFKEVPFLRILIPYCLGIGASLCVETSLKVIILLLVFFAIILFTGYFTIKSYNNTSFGIILTVVLFISGLLLARYEKRSLTTLEQKEQVFYSVVLDYPEEKENSFMIKSKLKYILGNSTAKRIKGSIVLYQSKDNQKYKFLPGDVLVFRTSPVEIKNKGNPCEFDYRFYMESKGFRYFGFIGYNDVLYSMKPLKRTLREKALIFREKIINTYRERGSKGKSLALAAAITLGEKGMLDENKKESFSRTGVMHVMAVSGLHAGILSLFIFNILFFLRRRLNVIRILITIAVLWLFAFTAGLSPSVIRASLMFSFLYSGQLFNRKINSLNSLLASAFILSLISPRVIFDPAFQLSYAAVLFIILFYRGFYRTLSFNNFLLKKLWQLISVSFVAQAGTFPLTLAMFNRFSVLFLLSNILIVPLASVIVISGFLSVITAPVEFISSLFVTVMDRAALLAGYLTEKTSMLPFSSLENTGITQSECFFLTVLMAIILYYLFAEKKISVVPLLTVFLFFFTVVTSKKIISGFNNELIVYSTQSVPVVGIKAGNTLNLFYNGEKVPREALRHSAVMGLHTKPVEIKGKMPLLVKAGKKRILISDNLLPENADKKSDIVIFTGASPFLLPQKEYPEITIFASDYPGRVVENRIRNSGSTGLWVVKSRGCFRMKLE